MPGKNLTRDEARSRAQLVSVDSYAIDLDLASSPETFRSVTTVRFSSTRPGASTFVDLIADSVQRVELNGESLDVADVFADHRVHLPNLAADNVLVVDATCRFTNTGEGLHRFVDPVDDEAYLYSQFEVPDSRRVFAVFEQPDLKATFAFTVRTPAHWVAISNQPTPEPTDDGATRVWTFSPTPRISSYITALCAGPYARWDDEYTSTDGRTVPLSVFARQSVKEHVDADDILSLTKTGFAFFEEEFARPYPFDKYDQIFAPEYNAGAMENAGCVTITDAYVFRGRVADALVERRALTILHEQAHMWFGDLVTMRWWDDLWLNESFAEWASTAAQAEATRWSDAWTTFCTHEKTWAYVQDRQPSTHPVEADMVDLQAVEVNFDGITYAKGGSILKQLVAYVGREPFREGLRAYFREHAWGNTELKDLLGALEEASGRDLSAWGDAWLRTSGVNTLGVELETDDAGTITRATVVQGHDDGFPTLRPHRLVLGAYAMRGDRLERTHRLEIDAEGERTDVPALVGLPRPDLLLPNDDDLTFCSVLLDETSERTVLEHPHALPSSLVRTLVLGSFWDRVRAGRFPARRFVDLLLAVLRDEHNSTALRTILLTTKQVVGMLPAAVNWYTAPEHREETRARTCETLRGQLRAAEGGSDRQFQLLAALAALASGDEDVAILQGVHDESAPLPGLVLDQELRWTLLYALAARGAAGEEEIAAEAARDDTLTGRERAARARAAVPTAEAKAEAWSRVVEEGGLSNATVELMGYGFARSADPGIMGPYVTRYHAALERMYAERSFAIAERFVTHWYPLGLIGPELASASRQWLDTHSDAPAALRRLVAENLDTVEVAVRAQACDARS